MIKGKALQYLIELYVDGIIKGIYEYKHVPRRYKKAVKEGLIKQGYSI